MEKLIKYAFLILPSLNRVYYESSKELAIAELKILTRNLSNKVESIELKEIAGLTYVTFQSTEIIECDIKHISNHSTIYALYEIKDDDLFKPIALNRRDIFDDDLISIQKYMGKTNEYFTKFLLNVTISSTEFSSEKQLRILDPMCGRGTTMLQSMMYGYDSSGIELNKNLVSAFEGFIKSYMKSKRLKHKFQSLTKKKQLLLETAVSKEDYKNNNLVKLNITNGDTIDCRKIFPKNNFHCIAVDLPYGVQHGTTVNSSLKRGPLALLKQVVPEWIKILKPGGCIGISWNVNTCPRDIMIQTLEDTGLEVFDTEEYRKFVHRVDQAVLRDVIIAKKGRYFIHPLN
ncbi:SAM-dependent methyltransferase [bacterium]|nr:SAM-dependent methyltransferase [bacterium]